jgi:translation initiation factor 2 alpha subunit (eIF-2alpha)
VKHILFASPKETIEMSYPDWAHPLIKFVVKYIKVKTVKLKNGATFKTISVDGVSQAEQAIKDKIK